MICLCRLNLRKIEVKLRVYKIHRYFVQTIGLNEIIFSLNAAGFIFTLD